LCAAAVVSAVPIVGLSALGAKGGDMPAQLYRSWLAARGVWLWDNYWYDGIYLPSYSLLYPPLAGLVGNVLLVGIGGVVSSVLFTDLARRMWGPAARWGGYVFALLSCAPLATGEYPYSLGVAAMVATLWWLSLGRRRAALAGAVLTVGFAPLAFVFLLLVLLGLGLSEGQAAPRHVRFAASLAVVGTLGGAVVLFLPVSGSQEFPPASLWPALGVLGAGALACLTAPRRAVRRLGVVLLAWCGACLVLYSMATPIGYNVTRIQQVCFPLLLAALAGSVPLRPSQARGRRQMFHGAFAVGALVASLNWTAQPYTQEVIASMHSRLAPAAGWRAVNAFLARHWTPDYRVEVAPTYGHWESYWIGRRYPLARGWYRQADVARNGLLFRPLTAVTYQRWLRDNAVRYVVVPAGHIQGQYEATLLRSGRSGLQRLESLPGFTIWQLPLPTPLLSGPAARISRYDHASISGYLPAAGLYRLRVQFNRFWQVHGSVRAQLAADGTTLLNASHLTRFSLQQPRL